MDRVEKASELHKSGYNCCQAVACAYADVLNIEEEKLYKLAECFGAGMSTMEQVCGAVSGALMAAGMIFSDGTRNNRPVTKKIAREIQTRFCEEVGSLICKEIKGVGTGNVLCSCNGCVRSAARILEEILAEQA